MNIQIANKTIETDEENFLLDPNDWDDRLIDVIAEKEGIQLTETHRGLVDYFRIFYEDHMRHPTMHELVKTLGKYHGKHYTEEKKYRDFIYELFPMGPISMLCKLAGLPKPVGEVQE